MKHLDLFSGIGGFSLAMDKVWPDVEHIFCEIDPFCQEVLKKHWPNSKIYGDIRTLATDTDKLGHIHGQSGEQSAEKPHETQREFTTGIKSPFILTGGFPCQPFSQAGRRKGTADDRYLWPEMLRVIREFHPRWVIGENVGGFVTWSNGLVFQQVHTDLEAEGYEVQSFIIPAVAVNAPHRRDRVWIVAHSNNTRGRTPASEIIKNREENSQKWKYPQFRTNGQVSNASDPRREYGSEGDERYGSAGYGWDANWLEVATRLCRVDDGLPRRLDRNPRLKALGNAIVPQVAEEIFKAIKLSSPPGL